jgi:hypothetical protein
MVRLGWRVGFWILLEGTLLEGTVKKLTGSLFLALAAMATPASAQNCPAYTYTFTNGQNADASEVNSNFNTIMTCANSNFAHITAGGANSDITSFSGLTTPLSAAQGGTGTTGGASGDLSGFPNPEVLSTHLSVALPVNQGGTGATSFRMTGGAEYPIASASTTDLGTATSNAVGISGTTTITSFGSSASTSNPYYFLRFTGAMQLTYNATSMILNSGGSSYTTTAGDTAVAQYLGSGNWKVSIIRADGTTVAGNGPIKIYSTTYSNIASVSYDGLTGYSYYEVVLSNIDPATVAVSLTMNLRWNGANRTSGYQWSSFRTDSTGADALQANNSASSVTLGAPSSWLNNNESGVVRVRIYPQSNAAMAKYDVTYLSTTPYLENEQGSAYNPGTSGYSVSGVYFALSSGNFSNVAISVYGYP